MSRLTFRNADTSVAWQKQLRDRYLSEPVPKANLSLSNAMVRSVSRNLAQQIILKYEWLGTMSKTSYHYGIFFDDYCAGVCCVTGNGSGTGGTSVHMPFHIERHELLILARGACVHWSPIGANSKLVSWTCKLLRLQPKGKILLAYSDSDAGEIGTIYQACNWVYIGQGSSTRQFIAPNGRVYDQKLASDLKRAQGDKHPRSVYVKMLRDLGYIEQETNPKHRYVFILDKTDKILTDRIEAMRLPYPKRQHADEATESAAGVQPDNGGATPTRSLLENK